MADPRRRRSLLGLARLCALLSLAALVVVVALAVSFFVKNLGYLLLAVLAATVVAAATWTLLTTRGPRKALAAVAVTGGLALLVAAVVEVSATAAEVLVRLVVFGVGLGVFAVAARVARVSSVRALVTVRGGQVHPPGRPVLLCNPKSGDGKVDRFQLLALAESLGVTTSVLEPGADLERLARRAVEEGADCLGMAGGDGSQALVASIAVEHDLAFVCIPAGTRNHFALDLGLDRDDPRKAMGAFKEGTERRVDYATVNGRLFVNNVSLGVYATVVQQEGYREDKAGTSLATLPDLLGRPDHPIDLEFTTPDGTVVAGPFLVQVSNNPYVLGPSLDLSQRRALDGGTLGVFAVTATTGLEAAQVASAMVLGGLPGPSRDHVFEFTTPRFEVLSRSGTAQAGVDGEALTLPTPLEFEIHPGGLRLFVPRGNLEVAMRRQARGVDLRQMVTLVVHPDRLSSEAAGEQLPRA